MTKKMCEGKCILLALPNKDFESLTWFKFQTIYYFFGCFIHDDVSLIAGGFVWQSARKRAKPPARQVTMTSPTTRALRIII